MQIYVLRMASVALLCCGVRADLLLRTVSVPLLSCVVHAALVCYKGGECSFTVLGDEC